MKKSVSAPCLQTFSIKQPTNIKRNISINSLPIVDDISSLTSNMVNIISEEIQVESVLHVPSHQVISCILTNKTFPNDILKKEDKNVAECLLEPDSNEDEHRIVLRRSTTSYLDLSEICEKTSERYASFLQKIRKQRKKNITEI